jgi:hypothetical protein
MENLVISFCEISARLTHEYCHSIIVNFYIASKLGAACIRACYQVFVLTQVFVGNIEKKEYTA